MTATEDFLKMPLKEKKCEEELYEDCRTRKLFEECNCIPWELRGFQVEVPRVDISISVCPLQDMAICDTNGRDCMERNSVMTFDCNNTCVGIYADVEWVKEDIEKEMSKGGADETMQADLEENIHEDLIKKFQLLERELKIVKNDLGEVMRVTTGKRGEELDRKKYKMLISEYRKFKSKNVKHFSFNTAADLSTYGEAFAQQ